MKLVLLLLLVLPLPVSGETLTGTIEKIGKKYLTIGRRVHIVVWDVSDGVVDAERVAIYETDIPARPAPSRPR